MAINIPILTEFSDNGIRAAKAAFGNFKTAVGDAQGGMNKFKAGATSAMDAVKANAALFAVAAGAAFVRFAGEAIGAFQDLALAVDKFSIASGMKAADASRWVEVAGDLGINVDQVQTAMGRMNRTIGENPTLFHDLGVDLVYAADGSLDVNATFLNTIQHLKDIKDPAQRAKEGVKLLGKGWTDMALLIDQGSSNLSASLASVSDAKIIDETEIGKARNFRDATNELKDQFEDLAITLGEDLVPVITAIVKTLAPAAQLGADLIAGLAGGDTMSAELLRMGSAIETVVQELGGARVASELGLTPLELLTLAGTETGDAFLYLTEQGRIYNEYTQSRIEAINGTTEAIEDQGDEVSETDLKWQALKGTLKLDSAMANAKEQLDQLAEKAIAAFQGADGALSEYEQGLIDAKLLVLELAESIVLTQGQKDRIRVLVDTGDLEYALALIDAIGSGGHADLVAAAAAKALAAGRGMYIPRALGGPVALGNSYLVGERGPELFTPSSSGNITPNSAMGGNTITVNVNGGDPDSVVRAIQKYARQNGAVPLQTTTGARF